MAEMYDVKFAEIYSLSSLTYIRFDFAILKKISFFTNEIKYSSFINMTMTDSTFNYVVLRNCTFINVTMSKVNFRGVRMNYVNFDDGILNNDITFSGSITIRYTSFRRAQMQNIKANLCEFIVADMSEANLTNSKMFATHLTFSNLINTDFTGADLSMGNLSHSNMLNAHITDEQLHSAISLENSVLPNGTIAHDTPLVRNGNADCNKIIGDDWKVEPPNSIIQTKWTTYNHSLNDENDCMFIVNQFLTKNSSITKVTMSQRINLIRYNSILTPRYAELYVTSGCNQHVKITLIERNINEQILKVWTIEKYKNKVFYNIETYDIEINLEFDTNANNIAICDNVQADIKLN